MHWWLSLVYLILTKILEGHLQYFQRLLVQNIHVFDGVYLQAEYILST